MSSAETLEPAGPIDPEILRSRASQELLRCIIEAVQDKRRVVWTPGRTALSSGEVVYSRYSEKLESEEDGELHRFVVGSQTKYTQVIEIAKQPGEKHRLLGKEQSANFPLPPGLSQFWHKPYDAAFGYISTPLTNIAAADVLEKVWPLSVEELAVIENTPYPEEVLSE